MLYLQTNALQVIDSESIQQTSYRMSVSGGNAGGQSDQKQRDLNQSRAKDAKARDLSDLLRKSGVSLILKVAGGLAAFLMTLVVGRFLGTTGAGLFFLSFAVVMVVAAICRLGFDQAITRFVSEAGAKKNWSSINGIYARAVPAVLLTSSTAAVSLFVFASTICTVVFKEPQLVPVFRWMSLSVVGVAVAWVHSHFFQGLQEIKTFQVFQNFGVTVAFLTALGLTVSFASGDVVTPETFGLCFFLGSGTVAVIAHIVWVRRHEWFTWYGNDNGWQRMWPTLMPLFGVLILQQISNWMPQIVLGVFRPAEEVGVYNAAFRLANLASLVLTGVNSVVFPKFAALHVAGESDRLQALAQSSARLMAVGCIPFLAVLMLFPSMVLGLFGNGFGDGARALQIIALGQLVNVLTGSVGGLLNMTGNQRSGLRCNLAAFAVTSIALISLTASIGFVGTAIAQALGVIVNMALLTYACRRCLGFAPITFSWRTSAAE